MIKKKHAHGCKVYECQSCHEIFHMELETGIEDLSKNHKPSPFVIKCPYCDGYAKDISGILKYSNLHDIEIGDRYFANEKYSDYGVPRRLGMNWENEMTAKDKDPLEKLGYRKFENHPQNESQLGMLVTQDEPYIRYISEDEIYIEEIIFHLRSKFVAVVGYNKEARCRMPAPLNGDEIKAISLIMQELGWL